MGLIRTNQCFDLRVVAAAAIFVALLQAPAHAARFFDFSGSAGLDGDQPTLDLDFGDVTATASATAYNPHADKTHEAWVGQYSKGLGVTNNVFWVDTWYGGGYWVSTDGSHTVDGKGWDDTLWLDFSKPIEFTSVKFSYIGYFHEDVRILDGDGNVLGDFDLSDIKYSWHHAHLDISDLDYTGTTLGLEAYGKHDSWKVKGIKGYVVPSPVAAGTGLALLLGILARRQRMN